MPSQFSKANSSAGLTESQAESVLLMYRALFEGTLENYKENLDWATACKLAGVPFSKFDHSYHTDFAPGGFREQAEGLYREAQELARGIVMAKVIHGKSLQAAKILLGGGMQLNVNIDNSGNAGKQISVKTNKKLETSLAQIPMKEAEEFIARHGEEVLDAEFENG